MIYVVALLGVVTFWLLCASFVQVFVIFWEAACIKRDKNLDEYDRNRKLNKLKEQKYKDFGSILAFWPFFIICGIFVVPIAFILVIMEWIGKRLSTKIDRLIGD